VLQFRMSRIKLMKCCMFLYLTDSNCVVADAVMYSERKSYITYMFLNKKFRKYVK